MFIVDEHKIPMTNLKYLLTLVGDESLYWQKQKL